jgi:hypothetical protein
MDYHVNWIPDPICVLFLLILDMIRVNQIARAKCQFIKLRNFKHS